MRSAARTERRTRPGDGGVASAAGVSAGIAGIAGTVGITDIAGHPHRRTAPDDPAGRASDRVGEVVGLLRAGVRTLTLTGPAGVGKTRLGIEVAHALVDSFDDGVVFVDLSATTDDQLVSTVIAEALGVSERPHADATAAVADHLERRHRLLVVDNCEQVSATGGMFAALGAHCPLLSVLATSRIALGVRVERQYVIEPLPEVDALALFTARAAAAGARPLDGPAARAAANELCRRVDRLPLAIELVAARAREHSAGLLLEELAHPLTTLATAFDDAPPRHRSLRTAIEWSLDLLDDMSRSLFARLGVFAGGWTREGARAVASGLDGVDDRLDTLLRAHVIQRGADDRMTMLVTFREQALAELDSSEAGDLVRTLHAEQMARLATASAGGLLGIQAPAWAALIAAEQDNLRAAFTHAMETARFALALQIAAGPWRYHWMRGLVREPLDRLMDALEQRGAAPFGVQFDALRAAGILAMPPASRSWRHASWRRRWRWPRPSATTG